MFSVVAPLSTAIWQHLAHEVGVGAAAVLGRELDVVGVARRPARRRRRPRPSPGPRSSGASSSCGSGDVAMKTWMRGLLGVAHRLPRPVDVLEPGARQAGDDRARAPTLAIASTASKSPWLAIGNPASMMSTPRRASCSAISSFSPTSSEMPGDCSPSRRVVSKIFTVSIGSSVLCGFAVGYSGNEKPPRPEGTRGRRASTGGRSPLLRSRPWVRSSLVMSGTFCQAAPVEVNSCDAGSRARLTRDEDTLQASARTRCARGDGSRVWRACHERRKVNTGVSWDPHRSRTRRNHDPELRASPNAPDARRRDGARNGHESGWIEPNDGACPRRTR